MPQLDNSKVLFRKAFGRKDEKDGDDILVADGPPSITDDEKVEYVHQPEEGDIIGEVFTEGPRLIDLGVDGKERPIGKSLLSLDSHSVSRHVCAFMPCSY